MNELPKSYAPNDAEGRWYRYWYDHHLYDAEADPTRHAFTVVIPPPNVTGSLTLGHVLNNTIQDIYIRWNRMRGRASCWIPGTDHAGIATQTKVVAALKSEGVAYKDLGREKFVDRVWEWKEEYGGLILKQLRALGVSVDWRRERFTMDEGLSQAVTEVFVRLFDQGLIYRGKKIVNWSPAAQTTLSDEEVNHREVTDKLYTLRYLLSDGTGEIQVATVRPETVLGDVAVAVNPADERYTAMVGKTVVVPLGGQIVPVIADEYPDPAFGTGALKITPAHDINDYEVGVRHNLPSPNTINPDGTMNELAGPLNGMDRFAARKKAVEMMEVEGTIVKVEEYTHSVGFSERGGEQIEPFLSDQWFVDMKPLAEPALRAVTEGHIRLYPGHWTKTYEHWMKNIRDWPISRQLWWGHRIPVYYTPSGTYTAAHDEAGARAKLGVGPDVELRQDEDVLDTWFSSWLWPFSLHGWGSSSRNEGDLAYFYPTDLLVTGPDIIFFWVARMIMAGLHFMPGEPKPDGTPRRTMEDLIPFRTVYFTSIIRDARGRKMSKSLGNSPDPLQVIGEYGADALRFTIIYLAPTGQDVRFSAEMCELGRNFANKLWNAARFLLMKHDEAGIAKGEANPAAAENPVSESDRWILSRFHSALASATGALDEYRINEYSKIMYDFVWGDFCDWYLELMKTELSVSPAPVRSAAMLSFAMGLFDNILRMLHPIMPYVTEELWQNIVRRDAGDSVSVQAFPSIRQDMISEETEGDFWLLQQVTESVRRMRNEAGLPPSKGISLTIAAGDGASEQTLIRAAELLKRLARIGELQIARGAVKPGLSVTEVVRGNEIHLHLEGLVDVEKEKEKIGREILRLEGQIRATEGKLSNAKFVDRAPADVVQTERDKLSVFAETIVKLRQSLQTMEG